MSLCSAGPWSLDDMAKRGVITPGQAEDSKRMPLGLVDH